MSTQLWDFEITRNQQEIQFVKWYDAWHFGRDDMLPTDEDGVRCTGGASIGVTRDGHGDGIRVLCNLSLKPDEVVTLLRKLAAHIEADPYPEQRNNGPMLF